jgi:hypothetical protein
VPPSKPSSEPEGDPAEHDASMHAANKAAKRTMRGRRARLVPTVGATPHVMCARNPVGQCELQACLPGDDSVNFEATVGDAIWPMPTTAHFALP